MKTRFYSIIHSKNINIVEKLFKKVLTVGIFKKIEEEKVLIYEDNQLEFSCELDNDSTIYMSGEIKLGLSDSVSIIRNITNALHSLGLQFSLDYQEENILGELTFIEFNISNSFLQRKM